MRAVFLLITAMGEAWAGGTEFQYRMRGEVRLLVLWLGRDGVGGGRIRVDRGDGWEQVEVVFGSDPARVPGRISRWGYGVERAERTNAPKSTFEGFMQASPEQSASEVLAAARKGQQRRFQSIRSEVEAESARSEIRYFDEAEQFDYRSPEVLLGKFRGYLTSRSPDVRRELRNEPRIYDEPHGFLTALLGLSRRMSDTLAGQPGKWRGPLPSTMYVFNARPYRLTVRRIRRDGAAVRADFESLNLQKDTRTNFQLLFPVSGEWRGVPAQISMQPRWWLRLRLDLVETRR